MVRFFPLKKIIPVVLIIVAAVLYRQFFFPFRTSSTSKRCIPSGTDKDIQKALVGEGAKAVLCQDAVFYLEKSIVFTAPYQEITTDGLPKEKGKALLKITNKDLSLAINGYHKSGIKIKNIRVDGGRSALGKLSSHGLILIGGNAQNQEVDSTEAYHSRSWTTIHVNWGNFYRDSEGNVHTQCKNAKIINNTIGPSGWAENGEWSDGISLQCEDSWVVGNTITDVTDGGIVVFGAPGSQILNNTIIARTLPLFVGIGLVDYQFDGNYKNTTVNGNTISAENSYIKVGIAMGPGVWWCSSAQETQNNRGAIVTNNRLTGDYFGYGYVINGVSDWRVEGNVSDATHSGIATESCGKRNTAPAPFLMQKENAQGVFQNEFKNANVQNIINSMPQTPNWLPAFCSGSEFRGCKLWGVGKECSVVSGEECKKACGLSYLNEYCGERKRE